ncbi:MAG: DUF4190 domain-containing protein [Rhodospirillales bacterium]|nr:DUF4190 domain-containing protein [Rhodospirillales bacterium]
MQNEGATPQTQVVVQQQPSNGLGTAGFITSIVGWVTCGVLCPIGVLLSLLGLFREPRGMAIAGLVVGLLGSIVGIVFLTVALSPLLIMLGLAGGAAYLANQQMQWETAMDSAAIDVQQFYDDNQRLPDDAEAVSIMGMYATNSGDVPRYDAMDNVTFKLQLPGFDGQWGTADDVINSYNVGTPIELPSFDVPESFDGLDGASERDIGFELVPDQE